MDPPVHLWVELV